MPITNAGSDGMVAAATIERTATQRTRMEIKTAAAKKCQKKIPPTTENDGTNSNLNRRNV